jgi:hypothetical protein
MTTMASETISISGSRPSRRNPAAAKITASTFPSRTCSIRVSTFPRIGTTSNLMSRPAAQSIICIARRGAPVPSRVPSDRSASRRPTRTSRVSSRAGIAMISRSSARVVGRSLSECTATSISSRRRASRTALTKTPVPPISVSWR